MLQEKRDRAVEEARKEREQELTEEEIKEIRSEVPRVNRQEIGRVPVSDDEDAKKDLELKCKMNLEKRRRVAQENQQKGSRIWHAIKHMPEDRRLHIRDILDIAGKENVPRPHPPSAEQQVSARLTPIKIVQHLQAQLQFYNTIKRRGDCLYKRIKQVLQRNPQGQLPVPLYR